MSAYYGKIRKFGVLEPKKLVGFPEGRIRLRMRAEDFTQAFVKTPDGIQRFYVGENENGEWYPLIKIGENKTI